MTYNSAKQDIEARYERGLCASWEHDEALEALEYEQGERMTAADSDRGIDS